MTFKYINTNIQQYNVLVIPISNELGERGAKDPGLGTCFRMWGPCRMHLHFIVLAIVLCNLVSIKYIIVIASKCWNKKCIRELNHIKSNYIKWKQTYFLYLNVTFLTKILFARHIRYSRTSWWQSLRCICATRLLVGGSHCDAYVILAYWLVAVVARHMSYSRTGIGGSRSRHMSYSRIGWWQSLRCILDTRALVGGSRCEAYKLFANWLVAVVRGIWAIRILVGGSRFNILSVYCFFRFFILICLRFWENVYIFIEHSKYIFVLLIYMALVGLVIFDCWWLFIIICIKEN